MRDYGLTPSMVDELGPPDDYCDNPYYARGATASLYRVERVEKWVSENEDRLEKAKANRAKRSAAAAVRREARLAEKCKVEAKETEDRRRAAAEDRRRAREWGKTLNITLDASLPETLIEDARKKSMFRGCENVLEERALVAHVRHEYTNHDLIRKGLKREECSQAMYNELRASADEVAKAALKKWAKAHPDLVKKQPPGKNLQSVDRSSPVSREEARNCRAELTEGNKEV